VRRVFVKLVSSFHQKLTLVEEEVKERVGKKRERKGWREKSPSRRDSLSFSLSLSLSNSLSFLSLEGVYEPLGSCKFSINAETPLVGGEDREREREVVWLGKAGSKERGREGQPFVYASLGQRERAKKGGEGEKALKVWKKAAKRRWIRKKKRPWRVHSRVAITQPGGGALFGATRELPTLYFYTPLTLFFPIAEATVIGRGCSTKDKVFYRECETHSYGDTVEKLNISCEPLMLKQQKLVRCLVSPSFLTYSKEIKLQSAIFPWQQF